MKCLKQYCGKTLDKVCQPHPMYSYRRFRSFGLIAYCGLDIIVMSVTLFSRFPNKPDILVPHEQLGHRMQVLEEYLENLLKIEIYKRHPETVRFVMLKTIQSPRSTLTHISSRLASSKCRLFRSSRAWA